MSSKFRILVFSHTRSDFLQIVLESLRRQEALEFTDVWIDGDQGSPTLRKKTDKTYEIAKQFGVRRIVKHRGNFGFRKIILQALYETSKEADHILVLEDDCFPTQNAVRIFRDDLKAIESEPDIFSVYGHPFYVPGEDETKFGRFQGWGWATTSKKLRTILKPLIQVYSLTEENYLKFINKALTPEILDRIEVTPGRQPSSTLKNFFAWDETLCLLSALYGYKHRRTSRRTIYNFGLGPESTHFSGDRYRNPPFNMIEPVEVWNFFDKEEYAHV
jgi:hypothetical protein